MFARNVAFSLKPNSVQEFTETFEAEVLPVLQNQSGFRDEIILLAEDNIHVHAISLWESREQAEAYDNKAYPQVLKALEKIVVGSPKVRISNVIYSSVNVPTASATAA
jgi:heme-degrading monooxygenase HmoA